MLLSALKPRDEPKRTKFVIIIKEKEIWRKKPKRETFLSYSSSSEFSENLVCFPIFMLLNYIWTFFWHPRDIPQKCHPKVLSHDWSFEEIWDAVWDVYLLFPEETFSELKESIIESSWFSSLESSVNSVLGFPMKWSIIIWI